MKKPDIATEIARQTGVTHGEAADQLDEVVTSILKTLKKGRSAMLPGLGRFRRNGNGSLQFTQAPQRRLDEKP
jgi:nucleoid DNA-binding protein